MKTAREWAEEFFNRVPPPETAFMLRNSLEEFLKCRLTETIIKIRKEVYEDAARVAEKAFRARAKEVK